MVRPCSSAGFVPPRRINKAVGAGAATFMQEESPTRLQEDCREVPKAYPVSPKLRSGKRLKGTPSVSVDLEP